MKRVLKKVLAVGLSLSLLAGSFLPVFAYGDTRFEHYVTGDSTGSVIWSAYQQAQTFTPQTTHTLEKVTVKVWRYGSGQPGNVHFTIRETSSGMPVSDNICEAVYSLNTITNEESGAWYSFNMTAGGANVSADSQYALVITANNTDYDDRFWWRVDTEESTYSGGEVWHNDYEAGWENFPALVRDFVFEEWGLAAEIDEPTCATLNATDVEYNMDWNYFTANISGNVTDDGDEAVSGTFYYQVAGSGNWSWANTLGTHQTGEVFWAEIDELVVDTTYEYFARVTNSVGYSDGDTLDFHCEYEPSIPTMITYLFPMLKGSDNVTLYGEVGYDGSSNVTCGFLYRISGEWIATDNVSGKETNDEFNIFVDNLTDNVTYEFRAFGVNDIGTGYGGIGEFTLYEDLSAPVVETLGSEFETAVDAYLRGKVTDHGGVGSSVGFEYRISGDIPWLKSHEVFISDNDTSEWQLKIENLTPDKTYEYRAYAWHSDIEGPPSVLKGYGEIMVFNTYEDIRIPVVKTDNATYKGIGVVWLEGSIMFDGGSSCAVWFQYREKGITEWMETEKAYGAYTAYEFGTMVFDLIDERNYEYRALAFNDIGTGFGSVKQFRLTEDEEGEPVVDETPVSPPWTALDEWMAGFGMDNPAGRWIAILALMALCFAGFYRSSLLRVLVPGSVFGIGLIIGWVDIWVTILLALGAGLTIYGLFKRKTRGGEA